MRPHPIIVYEWSTADKKTLAAELARYFKCKRIVNDWDGITPLDAGDLALTQLKPPFGMRRNCDMYTLSWAKHVAGIR